MWENPRRSAVCETQTSPSGTNNLSDAQSELLQVTLAMHCCHMIGLLDICLSEQLNRCAK